MVCQGRRVLGVLLIGLLMAVLTVSCTGSEPSVGASRPTPEADASNAVEPFGGPARVAAARSQGPAATVEELLAEGLHLAGASPVHLTIRGTLAATSVR